MLLLAFACLLLLAFAPTFALLLRLLKLKLRKPNSKDKPHTHNGESLLQHDGGMTPKWPESNFKANSKASRHDGYVCITGEPGEAFNRTLLPLGHTLRTLIS